MKIDKKALANPNEWAKTAALTLPDDARQSFMDEVGNLTTLADQRVELLTRQRASSRLIGAAKSAGQDSSALIDDMKALSQHAGSIEQKLREQMSALLAARTSAKDADSKTDAKDGLVARIPAYFIAQPEAGTTKDGLTISTSFSAEDYEDYVRRHPASTRYHDLALRNVIAATVGQRAHYLLARDENGLVNGVLPMVQLSSPLFGNFMVSMPWFNYGGPLADDARTSDALMHAAANVASNAGCSHAEIRETCPRQGWISRTNKVSMTRELPASVVELDQSIGSSLRAQSNKASRHGCEHRVGGVELLDDFYRVFSINMRDLGTPVQSREFFESLLLLYGDNAFLSVVKLGRTPVAAGFLISHGDTIEIPWASSLRNSNRLGTNMLLYRRTLSEAIERGHGVFDFGRSTAGGPTWRFKRQWGAVERPLYWHYWRADPDEQPGLSPDNPKYRMAIATWQRLPVALTRRLGPPIVRGLP